MNRTETRQRLIELGIAGERVPIDGRFDLTKADLTKADLRWANLREADLTGADDIMQPALVTVEPDTRPGAEYRD